MKHYKLTYSEYNDEYVEDTDKRITVTYTISDMEKIITKLYLLDIEYEIKRNLFNQLKLKMDLDS